MSDALERLRSRISSRFAARSPGRDAADPATLVVLLDGEPAGARRVLDSALAQDGASVEILVVVLAQPLLEPARERAAEDSRVVLVESVGEARAPARRRAVAQARGPAVLVLVPGAELVPGALVRLLARRAETRSAVVVGAVEGAVEGVVRGSPIGTGPITDLDAHPEIARLPMLARLLVDRTLLGAKESMVDDPDGSVTALGVLGDGFALEATVCLRDVRPGASRALFRVSPWPGLDALLGAVEAGDGMLASCPAALAERRRGLLVRELLELAEAAEDAGEDAWRRYVQMLLARVDRAELKVLPVEPRVLLWLACAGVRADVVRFVAARRLANGALPTVAGEGRVRAVLADPDGLLAAAPAYLMQLGESELALRARLTRLRIEGADLELVVQAAITLLAQAQPDDVRATLTLVSGKRRLATTPEVRTDPDVTRWMAERGQDHDAGSLVVRVPLADLGPDGWWVEVDLEVAGVRRRGVVGDLDPRGSAERAFLDDDPNDGTDVVEVTAPGPTNGVLSDVRVADRELRITVAAGHRSAELVGEAVTVPGVDEGDGRWRFALLASQWGFPERPAPTGSYRLRLDGASVAADGVLDRLPEEHLTASHRVLLRRGRGGNLVVRLSAPLRDDELGPRAQTTLQEAYTQVREPVQPGLAYFQSFTGQAVSDNPAALQAELHRRRAEAAGDLRMCWAVADSAAGVPPGAEPVLIRSRKWYDVLARASHLVTNVDLEPWFVRRPEQHVLQTSHGYPFKRMGLDQWRGRGFPDWRISQELARSSGTWTAVITPQPSVDSFYREQYAFEGRVLATGYPRDDVLTDHRAGQRRAEARARIGAGSRRVLLYAPTWRDDLATDHRAALTTHFVDLDTLSERLGPDWLLLRRGHRFHASQAPQAPGSGAGSGVLDVTSYPEVNDLMLAADVALLEYSSLRFDFALTGRPAVYFVPDLDRYAGEVRGFLHDYRDTAPGPLVDTLEEVVTELADLDGLAARWSRPIAELNAAWSSRQDGHASERAVSAFFAELIP